MSLKLGEFFPQLSYIMPCMVCSYFHSKSRLLIKQILSLDLFVEVGLLLNSLEHIP